MKSLLVVLLFFLLINLVSANEIEVNLLNDNYYPGMTFQAEVNINTLLYEDLQANQINLFFDGTRVDVVYLLKKVDEKKYFLYFKIPETLQEGTYELLLKDVVYSLNNSLVVNDITKEVPILSKIPETFYVEPGLIYLDLNKNNRIDFELSSSSDVNTVVNVMANNEYTYVSDSNIEVSTGNVENFYIQIDELIALENENFIEISNEKISYNIPFYLTGELDLDINETIGNSRVVFNVGVDEYRDAFVLNERLENKEIKIINSGDAKAENIVFRLTGNLDNLISLDKNSLEELDENQEYVIKTNFSNDKVGEYSGKIQIIVNGEITDEFLVIVSVVNSVKEKEDIIDQINNSSNTAEELESEDKTISYILFAFIIVIVVLIIVYIVYRKKISLSS